MIIEINKPNPVKETVTFLGCYKTRYKTYYSITENSYISVYNSTDGAYSSICRNNDLKNIVNELHEAEVVTLAEFLKEYEIAYQCTLTELKP
jgi:hypothetical protein